MVIKFILGGLNMPDIKLSRGLNWPEDGVDYNHSLLYIYNYFFLILYLFIRTHVNYKFI